jgi:hypothetical protein
MVYLFTLTLVVEAMLLEKLENGALHPEIGDLVRVMHTPLDL